METSRFFVANLPKNTTNDHVSSVFQEYGEVVRIELKTKENLVDPENVKILGFVTLQITAANAQYCLNELNWQKINGANIRVSLAKESFLDRLKREREEVDQAASPVNTDVVLFNNEENGSNLIKENRENTRKKFADNEEFDDDDIEPSLLISKKRAASSLHNGKIVIQSFDTTPLHVIEAKKHVKQHLDAKSTTADQKRKESQKKMKNQYQQQKSAIQQALSGLDVNYSKKKFGDSEEGDDDAKATPHPAKSKSNIFGSDDEDGGWNINTDLQLKPEYFGKKGEKLLQLQSKQSLDPRFKIDAKFVEGEVNDKKEYSKIDDENERSWQMGILEQVVGSKIDTGNAAQKAAKTKKMLRFDPANNEHKELLRTKQQKEAGTSSSKKSQKILTKTQLENYKQYDVEATTEVSKEVFYVVTDTLSQLLKTRGDGFSLLNMFSKLTELEQRENQLKEVSNEKILVNKMDKNFLNPNPFSYDTSSESESGLNELTIADVVQTNAKNNAITKNSKQKVKVIRETFFIPKSDVRLKEGAKFFKYAQKEDSLPVKDYEEVRNRLKLLIKTKITKSKRNLAAAGIYDRRRGRNKKKIFT